MIAIIGGGPSGLFAAELLASKNKRVILFEEHQEIGKPVQCTGLVTDTIFELVNIPSRVIKNRVNTAKIFSKNYSLILKLRTNIVLERESFDRYMAERALKKGAKIRLNERVIKIKKLGQHYKIFTTKSNYIAKVVIGADGPLSLTAKDLGLYANKQFLKSKQVTAHFSNDNSISFFLYPNSFGWIVPVNREMARIGVATIRNVNNMFDTLMQKVGLRENRIVKQSGGLIPMFNIFGRRSKHNAYLIGDAAGFVKATTGGGIIPGLISSKLCVEAIAKKKNYNLLWQKELGVELTLHKLVHRIMENMTDNDLDKLLKILTKKNAKTILSNNSRDKLSKWFVGLVLKNPQLFCYLTKLL